MAKRFEGFTVGMDESAVVTYPLDPSGRTGTMSVRQLIKTLQAEDPDAPVVLVCKSMPRPACGVLVNDKGVMVICDDTAIAYAKAHQIKEGA